MLEVPESEGAFPVLRELGRSELVDVRPHIGLQRGAVNFENQSSNSRVDISLVFCLGNRSTLAC